MTTFRSAEAMALKQRLGCPDGALWEHSAVLEIPVTNRQMNIPHYTSLFLAEVRKNEASVIVKTTEGVIIGDDSSVPREKTSFDSHFKCRMKNERRCQIFFVIHSARTWYNIKKDCFLFLSEKKMWLQRSPGPIRSTVMLALGFITNVPREASLHNIATEITLCGIENVQDATHNTASVFADPAELEVKKDAGIEIHLDRNTVIGTCTMDKTEKK